MGADAPESPITRIGEAAGIVWHYLDAKGTVPLKKLIDNVDVPRDLLMQAIGWLAREDKIILAMVKRSQAIGLKRA
jgi:hypothetical protein